MATLDQDFQLDLPIRPVTPKEIVFEIKRLDGKKAPGFDLITKEVLQQLPQKGIIYLTTLFNGILRVQHFPLLWKVSQIIMVYKEGKQANEVSSYRPISLLPVISKLFERVLLKRMSPALADRKIIPEHQFGFRQRHGTTEQVHRVYDTIRSALENKEYCSSAFLDIQQAFDRVWHEGLLCKIKTFLPHTYYTLLNSYLKDRIFQIKDGEETSGFYNITAGVPQGSVLGPVLYTIFTADLPETPNVTIATYADDTAILANSKNPHEASELLQNSLNKVDDWLKKWRMKASASKSVHVTFSLRRGDCSPVNLGNHPLPHSDTVKYLGMHLDRRLTWKKHLQTKRDQLGLKYRGLYWLLGRNSKLSVDNKLLIYNTVLKPVWTYGIQLWGSACTSNINFIQRFQNGLLKNISNAPWFIRNTELHEILNVNMVYEEIKTSAQAYQEKLRNHPNQLAQRLTKPSYKRRLKRKDVMELTRT